MGGDGAGRPWRATGRRATRSPPYDLTDGVQALEFNGAAALADDGTLYFGGVDGFNVFRPAELATARPAPPVVFTTVEVPGRDPGTVTPAARGGEAIVLAHDERTLALELADAGRAQVAAVAKRIVAAFDRPFRLAGHEVVATVSLGVALYPADGRDADDLLRHADAAMYRAKEAGRDRYCFYGDIAREAAAQRKP